LQPFVELTELTLELGLAVADLLELINGAVAGIVSIVVFGTLLSQSWPHGCC